MAPRRTDTRENRPPTARRAASRARNRGGIAELARALALLEARVAKLEKRRAGPGDGRAAVDPLPPGVKRCPGCGLALVRRKGRCAECGFPLDPLRRR